MHSNTEMIYQNTDRPVPVIYRYQQGGGGKETVYNSRYFLGRWQCVPGM
jgi:hypothetical protein